MHSLLRRWLPLGLAVAVVPAEGALIALRTVVVTEVSIALGMAVATEVSIALGMAVAVAVQSSPRRPRLPLGVRRRV